ACSAGAFDAEPGHRLAGAQTLAIDGEDVDQDAGERTADGGGDAQRPDLADDLAAVDGGPRLPATAGQRAEDAGARGHDQALGNRQRLAGRGVERRVHARARLRLLSATRRARWAFDKAERMASM